MRSQRWLWEPRRSRHLQVRFRSWINRIHVSCMKAFVTLPMSGVDQTMKVIRSSTVCWTLAWHHPAESTPTARGMVTGPSATAGMDTQEIRLSGTEGLFQWNVLKVVFLVLNGKKHSYSSFGTYCCSVCFKDKSKDSEHILQVQPSPVFWRPLRPQLRLRVSGQQRRLHLPARIRGKRLRQVQGLRTRTLQSGPMRYKRRVHLTWTQRHLQVPSRILR